jgi:hypothetical protein
MSAVCVLAPAVVAGWPAISAAVAGAAAALGFAVAREAAEVAGAANVEAEQNGAVSVEIAVEHSEVLGESTATGQEIVLTHGDVTVRVYRDERGQCRVAAHGVGRSRAELEQAARQVMDKMTQIYVYDRIMGELPARGFTVVSDEMTEDESVRIHVRLTGA